MDGHSNGTQGYTLPGVMHYLQTEWATNHRDRILMKSELEEMKCQVAKLTSENNSLRYINAKLQKQLDSLNCADSNGKACAREQDQLVNGLQDFELAPLIEARRHLEDKMREVVFLLKGTDSDLSSQLELERQRALLVVEDQHKHAAEVVDSDVKRVLTQSPAVPESPEYVPNGLTKDSGDIDTDNETVIAEEDADKTKPTPSKRSNSFTPSRPTTDYSKPRFTLKSHISQIRSLSSFANSLLTLASGGSIILWRFDEKVKKDSISPKEIKTYSSNCDDLEFINWISKDYFVVASHSKVFLWNINQDTPDHEITCSSRLTQLVANGDFVVLKMNKSVKILVLEHSSDITWLEFDDLNISAESIALRGSLLYVKIPGKNLEVYDISNKVKLLQTISISVDIDGIVQSLSIDDKLLALGTEKEVVVFDFTTNRILLQQSSKGVTQVFFTLSHIVIVDRDGSISIFSRDCHLLATMNHYDTLLKGVSIEQLSDDDKNFLHKATAVATTYGDDYVLTGGDDCMIHGFALNN
ncbi:Far8p CYBJADRAFT_167288 [Cyberlindnera jadinii NRRL Y-1542]|uniref:Striatin N-terminal domain-containing protein n=1 Tax=Cyberlindnera jadinii (strain ATCC 18201 / CBS 1600 / BCRC 20928 / JCM 3617 / NBRC 0987 / NRRL Y-1542) TaxID=983966 RepID=A0A1E4S2W2_CYBJN|nr:hypothetical protein CYBJADRAFT_167288 [Cyberlindnera jadinii NRRL Y-1542]ODV73874.1 hypothetical protein CYBJADRAFT_167288 [Cyberlindnera jadinii NRRL Y-1542]